MIFCKQYEEAALTHALSEPRTATATATAKATAKAKAKARATSTSSSQGKVTSTIANKPKRDNTP
jgi:hypothetical protein